jgi:hypothetical protein
VVTGCGGRPEGMANAVANHPGSVPRTPYRRARPCAPLPGAVGTGGGSVCQASPHEGCYPLLAASGDGPQQVVAVGALGARLSRASRLCAAHGQWLQELGTRFQLVWATANRLLSLRLGPLPNR